MTIVTLKTGLYTKRAFNVISAAVNYAKSFSYLYTNEDRLYDNARPIKWLDDSITARSKYLFSNADSYVGILDNGETFLQADVHNKHSDINNFNFDKLFIALKGVNDLQPEWFINKEDPPNFAVFYKRVENFKEESQKVENYIRDGVVSDIIGTPLDPFREAVMHENIENFKFFCITHHDDRATDEYVKISQDFMKQILDMLDD